MESLRKSFNTRHGRRVSGSSTANTSSSATSHEELPILFDVPDHFHDLHPPSMSPTTTATHRSPRISAASKPATSDSSVEFWNTKSGDVDTPTIYATQDPPSLLIGQFLQKQTDKGGDVALDMDLEMDELRNSRSPLPSPSVAASANASSPIPTPRPPERSKDMLRVSFDHLVSSEIGNSGDDTSRGCGGGDEVGKCTSTTSYRRTPTVLRAKTRSRLVDPHEDYDRRSGRMSGRIPFSGQFKSEMLGKATGGGDEDDDDLFLEEDVPEDLKKANLSTLTVFQWLSLILIIAILIVTVSIGALKKRHIWKLELWKWEVVILVLICGRLVSGWGIRIIVFLIERNFVLRKKLLYFVYGVRKAVQNCLWLGLVVVAWEFLLDKKVGEGNNAKKLSYVTRVLVCLEVAFVLWLIKTLIIKVLASSFHVSTYFDRIQESLFSQFVIETLSGPPQVELEEDRKMAADLYTLRESGATVPMELKSGGFPPTKSGRMKSPNLTKSSKHSPGPGSTSMRGDDSIPINNIHKLNQKNISAWRMKRLMKIVRHGALSTLGDQIDSVTDEDESANLIRSEHEAKAAARKIFHNVAKPGAKYIYLEDLMRFMTEEEALRTMLLCEGTAETNRISKRCLNNWLVTAFRDRKALALTLNDTKTAVNKLHNVANVIVAIIILVIWLLILGIATSKFFVLLTSELLLAAFIFGNTCKTVFEAIIFLFVMHPFDVGDRCEVDGVQMIVEEMNILTTIFLRYDNQKVMFPNSILSQKAIGNFYRSPDMGDAVEFSVHLATPAEKIALIRQKILNYIECKKEHWAASPMVIFKDMEDLNRVRIAVWLGHKMNHQNMGERWARRAILVEEIVKILKELDIQYRMLPLDINVRSVPPATTSRLPPTWVGNN